MRPETQRVPSGASCASPAQTDAAPRAAGPGSAPLVRAIEPRAPALRLLGHAPFVLAALAVLALGSTPLAVAWFAFCRLAYVGYVGLSLRAQSRRTGVGADLPLERAEAAWQRFRDVAARVMFGDALALASLSLVTRGTLELNGPAWIAAGLALIALGIGVKMWASASLDAGTFYWRDFFVPAEHKNVSASGPYRWLSDPMYSLGYAHAYGFALLLGSGPGLAGAAFAQLAVLLLARLVERPHVLRRVREGRADAAEPIAARRPPAR